MRRIYYSSKLLSAYKYISLDIWGIYLSVTIQFLRCNFTVWPVSDAIEIFKSIDHSSTVILFLHRTARAVETNRPGTHRRVAIRPSYLRCILENYVFLPFNKLSLTPIIITYRTNFSVEMAGFEPATFALQRRCSPTELHPQDCWVRVGLTGFEPVTPALSAQCSNQLSYKPAVSLTTE